MTSGLQLDLFDNAGELASAAEAWGRNQAIGGECAAFAAALVATLNLAPSSAEVSSRYLAAMVRESDAPTVSAFIEQPPLIADTIRMGRTAKTRLERHRAVNDYAEVTNVPLDQRERIRTAIEGEFGGRPVPKPDLIDLNLGGDPKEVRTRLYPTWDDGDRMIQLAGRATPTTKALRDGALVALHVRSGLPPGLVERLAWSSVPTVRPSSADITSITLEFKGRIASFAVHTSALELLDQWRQAEGMPETGPVFNGLRRPRRQLASSTVRDLMISYVHDAGLPPTDRRHLRAVFAWKLRQLGWSDLRIRDGLGYQRVREVDRLLQPFEERAAQIAATEFIMIPDTPAQEAPTPASLVVEAHRLNVL